MKKVYLDKEREARDGHDGTWVAHPDLVSVAREVFDGHTQNHHQIHVNRDDVFITAKDLLRIPSADIPPCAVSASVNVGLQYLESWLRGKGLRNTT